MIKNVLYRALYIQAVSEGRLFLKITTSTTLSNWNPKPNHSEQYHNHSAWLSANLCVFETNKKSTTANVPKTNNNVIPKQGWQNVPWSEICEIQPETTDMIVSQGWFFYKMVLDQKNASQSQTRLLCPDVALNSPEQRHLPKKCLTFPQQGLWILLSEV